MPDANNRPDQLDSPVVAKIMKWGARAQTRVYRATKGRIGGKWRIGAGFRKPVSTLLLDHRGRRSGRCYTTPLLYLRDGRSIVVVASQGGLPQHPQWYRNLVEHPDTTVQVGGEVLPVRARVATGAERAELWAKLVDLYADFDTYQAWTDRTIPVVVLEPR